MRRIVLLSVLALAGIAACGGGDGARAAGDHNRTDVTFLQGMIQHHERSSQVSGDVITRVQTPEVKDFARRCQEDLEAGSSAARSWLDQWGEPLRPQGGEHSAGHGPAYPGMPSSADHDRLKAASGLALEKLFLEAMTRHHKGAVQMADEELNNGKYPEAKKLAQDIWQSHQADLMKMNQLLVVSPNSSGGRSRPYLPASPPD